MSQLSWPGNRRQHVTPDRPADTKWFRSPYVGVVSFSVRKQISYKASLSRQNDSSEFSTSWCTLRVQLYGSTTVSETFGDGTIENVNITRSGYSSRILEIRSVPMPAPVPPPRECVIWKPWRQSQPSASLRTTSSTESMSSAPSVSWPFAQLFPAPVWPKTKLSGRKSCPNGPARTESIVPGSSMPCSSEITSQNFAPIWLPHWPPWMCTSSRICAGCLSSRDQEGSLSQN